VRSPCAAVTQSAPFASVAAPRSEIDAALVPVVMRARERMQLQATQPSPASLSRRSMMDRLGLFGRGIRTPCRRPIGHSALAILALVTVLHHRPRDLVTKASTPELPFVAGLPTRRGDRTASWDVR
jgi:hypothetical protein